MTITIILSGVPVRKEVPTMWEQVTFHQFVELAKIGDVPSKIISLFTGVDHEVLRKAKIFNLDIVLSTLAFLQTPMKMTVPKKLFHYDLPDNLEFMSTAQYEDLKLAADKMSVKPEDAVLNMQKYPLMLATYCAEPYSWERAEKISKELWNAPCPEVIGGGNFIWAKLLELKTNTKLISPKGGIPTSRFVRGIQAWLRNTVFSIRLRTFKKRLAKAGQQF